MRTARSHLKVRSAALHLRRVSRDYWQGTIPRATEREDQRPAPAARESMLPATQAEALSTQLHTAPAGLSAWPHTRCTTGRAWPAGPAQDRQPNLRSAGQERGPVRLAESPAGWRRALREFQARAAAC